MRVSLSLAVVCACGGHNHGDPASANLSIDPPMSELMIIDNVEATEDFTATLAYPDGYSEDVTSDVVFTIDGAFGSFASNHLSMMTAGKTQVFGQLDDKQGSAQVIARLKGTRVDPSLPPNTTDLFNLPEDPSRAPTVVYPAHDVIVPRNLGDFEVHWTDAHGNDIFELSLQTEFADVRVYVPGGNGVAGTGPEPSWAAFLAPEWLAAVGLEESVTYQVRGVQSTNPVSVGSAPPEIVTLGKEAMEGGLYYWSTASATGVYGIYRHDMSLPGQPAEEYMTTNQTSNRCVACHVLSRDGTKMAVTYDGGGGASNLIDVGTKALQTEANKWNFATFTPDGSQLLSVEQGALVIRSSTDQSVLGMMPSAGYVTHPDLSPDGTRLVYVRPGNAGADWSFTAGAILERTYDQNSKTFGPEIAIVADGNNNYYPSFSPDGAWILFNKAPSGDAYNNTLASVWVIKSDNSGAAVQLANLNKTTGITNSWARWAPFAQTYGPSADQMYWITVSSKRDFGVRLFNSAQTDPANQIPQLWMTPFFPARAAQNMDPSAPSFRLPFQNLDSRNHIAQWTEKVVVTQ
jgi:WD40-like Beta Propeller Repeat